VTTARVRSGYGVRRPLSAQPCSPTAGRTDALPTYLTGSLAGGLHSVWTSGARPRRGRAMARSRHHHPCVGAALARRQSDERAQGGLRRLRAVPPATCRSPFRRVLARFESDSPLERGVMCELVSEFPQNSLLAGKKQGIWRRLALRGRQMMPQCLTRKLPTHRNREFLAA
jgi:hypothetical protein